MVYEVERKGNKIFILHTVDSDVCTSTHFEVKDTALDIIIQQKMKLGKVYLDTKSNGIFNVDEKYYNVPITDSRRVSIIKQAKRKLESLVQTIDMVDYINYIDINNELHNKGIFISDNNREEKYIEVLETCDEKLIDCLEQYLELKDRMTPVKNAKKNFNNILRDVMNTKEEDIAELVKIENSI